MCKIPRMSLLSLLFSLVLYLSGDGWYPSFNHVKAQQPPAKPAFMLTNDQPVRFERFTTDDGLSQSSISAITQDSLGFLWFATEEGLNRFDGYEFQVYRSEAGNPNSLSANNILSLCAGENGDLWIGTNGGGLNRLDRQTGRFTRYLHHPDDPSSLAANTVSAIAIDQGGRIWVGTSSGLDMLNPRTGIVTHYPRHPYGSIPVTRLLVASDGGLWVGSSEGLTLVDPESGQFTNYQYALQDLREPDIGNYDDVTALYEDGERNLWVGTYNGLGKFDLANRRFIRISPAPTGKNALTDNLVWDIRQDTAGTIWIATRRGGLNAYDPVTDKFSAYQHNRRDSYSLSSNEVTSLYIDRQGNLWAGTNGGGANLLLLPGGKPQPFRHLANDPDDPNSLANNLVFAIHQDADQVIWFGTQEGLDRYDPATGQFTHLRPDPTILSDPLYNNVSAICRDYQGYLWVGTISSGLYRFDPATGRFDIFRYNKDDPASISSNVIRSLGVDSLGNLWIGTTRGLDRFEAMTSKFTRYQNDPSRPASLMDNRIWRTYEDRSGRFWVGTDSGLERLDRQTGAFTHLSTQERIVELGSTGVLAIHEDRSGRLWLGTFGSGLGLFDGAAGKISRFYRVRDGLPSDVVYGILEDQRGYLWLSTNAGLSRFDPASGRFKNFDVKDGLQGNEFNVGAFFQSSDGTLLFGGINGVTLFDPTQVIDNTYIPPVALTSLTRHGESILSGQTPETLQEITLRWPDNYFEFEFAALNFARPEKNQYAYKLEGFDRDWNVIGAKRSGRYTNLPGKSYTLRIKGSNNDGIWNEEGTALRVIVVPPFWETWWFRGTLAAGVLALVGAGLQVRVKSIQRRNRELEALVQARTAQIEQLFEQTKELAIVEERNRLARDLHDSAKQKAFAALAQLGAAKGLIHSDVRRAKSALGEAENLVYEVIEELSFLIQEMYPAALKEKGLAAVLREYVFEWENRGEIQTSLVIHGDQRLPLEVEQALYRVVQEALANVARHSRASQVNINVDYQPEAIQICIHDNGCGFDPEQKPIGMGLQSMQARVSKIGGTLTIESAPGKGTRLCTRAPVPQKNMEREK